ncbi:hypothetical protein CHUAL_013146 [Chamberlinius hualienensis]
MLSVTPERPHERPKRRDRSSSSGSDRSAKRRSKETTRLHSRHERNASGYRNKNDKRPRREERGSDHKSSRRDNRSRSRSKSQEKERPREKQRSHASRQRHGDSKLDPSRVVIKQEPLSGDEDQTRQSRNRRESRREPERVAVKTEHSQKVSVKSDPDDKKNEKEEAKPKEKPNFKTSGKLAEDTNIFNGVVVKYNEPPEAKKPLKKWRLYGFKGEELLPMLPIHRQSAYLLGRERKVADIPIDHPSCSKQHAVLQFRALTYKREDGTTGKRVRPYIIDLESSNGTFVNNQKIEPRRYVELLERDVLKFGFSTREYVLLHEGSTSDDQDDEVNEEEGEGESSETTAKEDKDK